mgnify:CR=1 FL=1
MLMPYIALLPSARPFPLSPIIERTFWDGIQRCTHGDFCVSCCWLWSGRCTKAGYGIFYAAGQYTYVHRAAWFIGHREQCPPGMVCRHICDIPPCGNPCHIIIGTQADNLHDMFARHRRKYTACGERHGKAKLTWVQVEEMRRRYAAGEHIADLARWFSISFWAAEAVVKYKHWHKKESVCP